MPKLRRGKSRKHSNADAIVSEAAQIKAQLAEPRRPRTRAFVKQEGADKRKGKDKLLSSATLESAGDKGSRRAHTGKTQLLAVPQSAPKQTARATTHGIAGDKPSVPKAVKTKRTTATVRPKTSDKSRQTTIPDKTTQQKSKGKHFADKGTQTQPEPSVHAQIEATNTRNIQETLGTALLGEPAFTAWLNRVEPVSPEGVRQAQALYTAVDSDITPELKNNMDSSSASRGTGGYESTTKQTGYRSVKVSENKLRLRRVDRTATPDERLQALKSILKSELPARSLKEIRDLQSIAQDFLQQIAEHPDDTCYPYIDDFSFNFDQGKSKISYPVVNRKYFDADLKRCLARNEAILQRTVMIHIINQYWLGKIFDWNTEGQWSLPKECRLPSREDDDISLPKPDLAISFTLESFTGSIDDSAPIPQELESCMSPDGGGRCFPFLFFEVKKAASDLENAYLANLHNASQALYNMYNWMVRADKEEQFFDDIRVFSLVFNAQDLHVLVHRAIKLPTAEGALKFQFDELSPSARYTKDGACLLIKTILDDYATKELHLALKTAFEEVTAQEDERVASKRKANLARSSSSKRPRRSQNHTMETGQSFAMSNLAT